MMRGLQLNVAAVVVDFISVSWYSAFDKLIGNTNKVLIRIKKYTCVLIKIDKR